MQEFFVQYHITNKCNLNCKHCYQNFSNSTELSTKEILNSIKEISDLINYWKKEYTPYFHGVIQITGGEPFLRDDIFEIIDYCKDKDLYVVVMTNGVLIDNNILNKLDKENVKIQLSLEGLKSYHDYIRGKGSFDLTINKMKVLLDAKISTSVNITLMRSNLEYFWDVIDVLERNGLKTVGVSRFVNEGKGSILDENINKKDLKKLYLSIKESKRNIKIYCKDPLYNTLEHKNADYKIISGCSIGFWGFTILHDGTLLPCSRLNIPFGNIKDNYSIRELWVNSALLWKFRDFSNYNSECKDCIYLKVCRGCRAIAFVKHNNYLASDPQCFKSIKIKK